MTKRQEGGLAAEWLCGSNSSPCLSYAYAVFPCKKFRKGASENPEGTKKQKDHRYLYSKCFIWTEGGKMGRHWGRISSPKPTEQLEVQGHNYVTSANLGWYETDDTGSIRLMSPRVTWLTHLESHLGISEAEMCVKIAKGSSKEEKRGHLCYCGVDGLCPWHHGMAAFRGGRNCLRCGSL